MRDRSCACGKPVKGRGRKCSACYTRDYRQRSHATRDLNVRVDPETKEQLEAVAREQGTTKAAKIREYVEWGLENDGVEI